MIGNLTRDPELRYTASGRGVASAGIACNRRWQKDGEWQEEVSFFNITAWAELGENWAASCKKGDRIIVTGRLTQRSYETREGEKRNVVEVVADAIGPDLKYATCEVAKIERDKAGGKSQADRLQPQGDEEPF